MSASTAGLPTFLVVGTNKASTTTLYAVLKQHPEVFLPFRKELHFFNNDENYARGVDWYVRTFFAKAEAFTARGDITPAYLYWGEKVIPRVKMVYGNRTPRMVAILRDPVARAYSRYWHERRLDGREPLSFEQAIEAEDNRIRADARTLGVRGRFPHAYFRGGLYGEQLARYFDAFPRDHMHVILFHEMWRDFDGTMRGLLAFLGIDPGVTLAPARRNPASVTNSPKVNGWFRSRSVLGRAARRLLPERAITLARRALRQSFLQAQQYPPIDRVVEQQLRQRYLPDIHVLERLLGRELREWYPEGTDARWPL